MRRIPRVAKDVKTITASVGEPMGLSFKGLMGRRLDAYDLSAIIIDGKAFKDDEMRTKLRRLNRLLNKVERPRF